MEVPGICDVLEFTSSEECLSLAADVAVGLAVVEDPNCSEVRQVHDLFAERLTGLGARGDVLETYWDSLAEQSPNDVRWRDLLLKLACGIPEARRAIVMADLCLESSTVDFDDLTCGLGARRLNAVLDIVGVPFCSSDVQSYHLAMADNLATLKANRVHEAGAYSAAVAGGFAGGFFMMPFVNSTTQKGIGYFMDQVQSLDPFSLSVSALLVDAVAAAEADGGESDFALISEAIRSMALKASREFAQHRRLSGNLYTGDAAQADRHRRVLNGAIRVLDEIHPRDDGMVVLEDVVGMPLSAARTLLESEGLVVTVNSGDRMVMNENNWVVTAQSGAVGKDRKLGTPVLLNVAKYGSS